MELACLRMDAALTREDAARLCQVTPLTWYRWEKQINRTPAAVIELLRLLGGDLSRQGWPGWRLGRDGLLYNSDRVQGFSQGDIRRIWWDRQALDHNRIELRGLRSEVKTLKKENQTLRERLKKQPQVVYRCPLQDPEASAAQ